MNRDELKTPSTSRYSLRSTGTKRDTLAAELERDPQHSTAKRHARSAAFTSHLASASLSRELLTLKTAKVELETKLREKDAVIEKLEGDRRWLSEREKEEKEARIAEGQELEEAKRKAEDEARTLRNTTSLLQEELADLRDTHSSLSLSTSNTIASQQSQISSTTQQFTVLTTSLADCQRLAEERGAKIRDLEDRLESPNVLIRKEESADWNVLNKQLLQTTTYLQQLESANSKLSAELTILREKHASVEVLKEEKSGLERNLKGLEEMRKRVVILEAELEKSKNSALSVPRPQTPIVDTHTLSSLRLSHAKLLEEHGITQSSLSSLERTNVELTREVERLSGEVVGWQERLQERERDMKRKEMKYQVGEREVRGLKALLASYEAEQSLDDTSPAMEAEDASTERIRQLEALLEEYKNANRELEGDIEGLRGGSSRSSRSWKQLTEDVERLTAEKATIEQTLQQSESSNASHLEKIESLSQELFELSGEIAGGRHVPPGTRILSLKDNPAQVWADTRQAVLDRLRKENEALLARLADLEEAGVKVEEGRVKADGEGEGMVPRESWELVSREKKELEEVVKQKEKRLLRLQQVFASKSAEFREAIASILGLKLAFYPNGQVRVTSMYDLNASFVFQPTSKNTLDGMTMQLVAQGEGGPQDLPQMMRYWIEEEECIPGFLASVTLECWDKRKREGVVKA